MFDRFRQADASASRRHGGLGLALVRQIVELHGGSVSVESAGKNRFSSSPSTTATIILDGVTVLLVDDSQDGREMLAAGLRGYGARVEAVASADDALRMLMEQRLTADIMVSDIGMPGVDGYQLIRRLRESGEFGRQLPAIAVTAYADPEDRIRALTAGYQLHVPKPVDAAALAAAIVSLVAS